MNQDNIKAESITLKYEKYDSQNNYLFFEKDNEILNLDKFRYDDEHNENVPEIKAKFTKGKYSGKEAFVINRHHTYNIYYNNKIYMKIEPDQYGFSFLGVNGNKEYFSLTFKNKKLDKIPDEFTCEFNGIPIEKNLCYNQECFDITDFGEYIIKKNNNFYRKLITHHVWNYYFEDGDE
ncbi:4533_t:CDS:1, partial [Scutellospora calospora]